MMRALKFLRAGRVGPFTGTAWPEAGTWLDATGELRLCRSGIHGLRPSALPFWLAEELWQVELDEAQEPSPGVLLARRGRLVELIGDWNDDTARSFAQSCLDALPDDPRNAVAKQRRSHAVDVAHEVTASPSAAWVAYIVAKTLEAERPGGYEQERQRQAAWLQERLGLKGATGQPGG
jgi:hypothetical protein